MAELLGSKKKKDNELTSLSDMAGQNMPRYSPANTSQSANTRSLQDTANRVSGIRSQNRGEPVLRNDSASVTNTPDVGSQFSTSAAKDASARQRPGVVLSGGDIRDQPGGVKGPNDAIGAGGSSGFSMEGGGRRVAANPANREGIKGGTLSGTAARYTDALRARRQGALEGLEAPQGGVLQPASVGQQVRGSLAAMAREPGLLERTQQQAMQSQLAAAIAQILGGIARPSAGGMGDFDQKWYSRLLLGGGKLRKD